MLGWGDFFYGVGVEFVFFRGFIFVMRVNYF